MGVVVSPSYIITYRYYCFSRLAPVLLRSRVASGFQQPVLANPLCIFGVSSYCLSRRGILGVEGVPFCAKISRYMLLMWPPRKNDFSQSRRLYTNTFLRSCRADNNNKPTSLYRIKKNYVTIH